MPSVTVHTAANRSAGMKEAMGPWRLVRTLGRDLSGVYYSGRRDDGRRATLYVSSDIAATRGDAFGPLLRLHRDVEHPGLVCFRSVDRDGDEEFLLADAVDDAMASLRRRPRPDPGQTRTLGVALAAALVAAHDSGLVHGGLELDNVLWASGHAPRILGAGVASIGASTSTGVPAHSDVVGLGRLLCALVASWSPRGAAGAPAADSGIVELVRMLAEPGAALSMREAHALLAGEAAARPARATEDSAASSSIGDEGSDEPDDSASTGEAHTDVYLAAHDTIVSGSEGSLTEGSPSADAAMVRVPPADPRRGRPGDHVGRYRLLNRLGRGGMGEVFLAEDPTLRRGVAIKRIRPDFEHDRSFRARLRREAQLAARLGHRAIVQVFDLITTDDEVDHVVMEYVPSPSLHTLLAGGPMPVAEAVRIAIEIADGLAYAHQQGVVHRDLKLENILISLDGQPKIADFGLARRTAIASAAEAAFRESVTREGVVIGTVRAMSPEQIRGQDVDARSDLFSFGVLLYELVTGNSPFVAEADPVTMMRVLSARQLPACVALRDVPEALSELIDHLLEKDPAQRPETARAVCDRLRQFLDEPRPRSEPRAASQPSLTAPDRTTELAAAGSSELASPGAARDPELPAVRGSYRRVESSPGSGSGTDSGRYPSAPRNLRSKIQAPFVLAEIRALRSSIFKRSPEIQTALAIADKIEQTYDLRRADLFIPAFETFCAMLEPFAVTLRPGKKRRGGNAIIPA